MPLTPDQIAVLEQFRPRSSGPAAGVRTWHILTHSADSACAEALTRLGLLERRSQRRKGFPPLHRITDAGMAALPVEAADRAPVPDTIFGSVSPPRGY